MDHEVVPCQRALFSLSHFMVTFPQFDFYENIVLKALGPWLGVNWTWIKRSDHAPKSVYIDLFFNICPKRNFWEFSSCLTFFPSSLITIETSPPSKKKHWKILKRYFLRWSLDICSKRTSFASPTTKSIGPWQLIL